MLWHCGLVSFQLFVTLLVDVQVFTIPSQSTSRVILIFNTAQTLIRFQFIHQKICDFFQVANCVFISRGTMLMQVAVHFPIPVACIREVN